MDLCKYIESCTKIEANRSFEDVEWFSVPTSENVNHPTRDLPYHLEIEKGFYESDMEIFEDTEHQNDDSRENKWEHQFADIRASVREIGLGWNIFSIIEKRYKESQKNAENNLNESSSESNYSYTTANSVITDDSYSTALEDFDYQTRPSENIKSDISIDSSIDKSRYRKNALITKLLQSAENSFSNADQVLTDYSTDESNLITDTCNEKKNENDDKNEEKFDSKENMYQDGVLRLLQSKEDEDVYVHPLREQIKEDPVWQAFRLSRKGIETTETPRQYYMSIPEEQFAVFEQVESKKKSKTRRKYKKRYTFNK